MARPNVRQVSGPSRITPVASPVDAFVVPAQAPRSNLGQLAQGLAAFDSGLGSFLKSRAAEQEKGDKLRGENAFNTSNKQGFAEAVRTGSIPANESPAFVEAFKKSQGVQTGLELRRKWNEAYFNWDGRNSNDPQQFDDFFGSFLKNNITSNDPDVLRGLNPLVKQLAVDAFNQNVKLQGERMVADSLSTNSAVTNNRIQDSVDLGESDPKGANFNSLWDNIIADRTKALSVGTLQENFDKGLVNSIIAKAIENGDESILDLLDRKLPGSKNSLSATTDVLTRKVDALNKIDIMRRSRMREESRMSNARDKQVDETIVRNVTKNLAEDPTYQVPEMIMKQWEKVNPGARLKFIDTRRKLLESKGQGDPSAILDLHQKLRSGAGEDAINDALSTGVIRNRQEYAAAYAIITKMRSATERKSTILSSRTATRFRKTFKTRTDGGVQDILGIKGMSDEGLQLTQEFELQLLEWDEKNPDASPIEREKAINEIGNAINSTITDPEGDTPGKIQSNRGSVGKPQDKQEADAPPVVAPPVKETPATNIQPEPTVAAEPPKATVPASPLSNFDEQGNFTPPAPADVTPKTQPVEQPATPQVTEPEVQPLRPEQKRKLGSYGGDVPPALDTLTEAQRKFIKDRAKKTGKSEDDINNLLWQRLQKLIKSSSLVPKAGASSSLIAAVKTTESVDNPRAVSPAGAVGIMQVMPDTARDIASALKDTNFPSTTDGIIEYLKDPEVGERYGTFYLNQQLVKYKGDTEAALIAYNAGPGNANKWLKAGRDYSVLPRRKETEAYVRKISGILNKESQQQQQGDILTSNKRGRKPDISNLKPDFVSRVTSLQKEFGQEIPVVSGFRGKKRNAKAGGAKHSRHIEGDAVDLDVSGLSKAERVNLIALASSRGFKGIGVYANSIHIDQGSRRSWGPTFKRGSVPGWAEAAIKQHLKGTS